LDENGGMNMGDTTTRIILERWLPPIPHGRLIDADVLYEIVKKRTRNYAGGWSDIECVLTGNDIKNAPTIIPAESAEDGET
jgi:hypothetical protein